MMGDLSPEYDMSDMRDGGIDMDCYQTLDEGDGDVLELDLLADKSSGIVWVGVHGMDSICVVTRTGDLEVARVDNSLQYDKKETVLHNFRKAVISKIKELEDMSRKLGNSFGQRFKKPFAVVSVIPCVDKVHKEHGHEAFSVEYDGRKAMEFLKEKVSCGATFTVDETIRTAISAFQHLFRKKFEANEIEVSVDYQSFPKEAEYKDAIAKELAMSDIKDHLAFINEPVNAVITMPDGEMDGSETIRDGDMDGSKTINYKDMDPSLTAELRSDGEKCGAEFVRHEYIYNSSMAPADKAIQFSREKMKMDTFTVNESTQGFATGIVGVCDSEARFGVLAVESYVSTPAGERVQVLDSKTNKLVNVFDCVYLTATGSNYLICWVRESIKKEVTAARSMLEASKLVTNAINKILRPSDPVLDVESYQETLFVLMGGVRGEYHTYVIRYHHSKKAYRAERLRDRVFYFGSGESVITEGHKKHRSMRKQKRRATEKSAALRYCIDCLKFAIENEESCGGEIHAAVISEDQNGIKRRYIYKKEERLGKIDYYPQLYSTIKGSPHFRDV